MQHYCKSTRSLFKFAVCDVNAGCFTPSCCVDELLPCSEVLLGKQTSLLLGESHVRRVICCGVMGLSCGGFLVVVEPNGSLLRATIFDSVTKP